MYFCQKCTGKRLKDIGAHFSIGKSGVSQANRRLTKKIEKDKNLKRK